MNLQCELRAEMNLDPLPHWRPTRPTPDWAKIICGKLRRTILKSVLRLKPKSATEINWRNYGRCIGIMERHKTFLFVDVPRILEKEGINDISPEKWEKIQPLLGDESAREYYLKALSRPADDPAPLAELAELASHLLRSNNSCPLSFSAFNSSAARIAMASVICSLIRLRRFAKATHFFSSVSSYATQLQPCSRASRACPEVADLWRGCGLAQSPACLR